MNGVRGDLFVREVALVGPQKVNVFFTQGYQIPEVSSPNRSKSGDQESHPKQPPEFKNSTNSDPSHNPIRSGFHQQFVEKYSYHQP